MFKHIVPLNNVEASTHFTSDNKVEPEPKYIVPEDINEYFFMTIPFHGTVEEIFEEDKVEETGFENNQQNDHPEIFADLIETSQIVNNEPVEQIEQVEFHVEHKLEKNYNYEKNLARVFRDDFQYLEQYLWNLVQNVSFVTEPSGPYFENAQGLFFDVVNYVNHLDWQKITKMEVRGEFKKVFDFSEDFSPIKQVLAYLVEEYFKSDMAKSSILEAKRMKLKTREDLVNNIEKYTHLLLHKHHKKEVF